MYAYAGFPRSLNGINALMAVMDERQAKGITDALGQDASPVPADMNRDEYGAKVRARLAGRDVIPPPSGYQLFTPVIDTFLKEQLFADIFARDTLDFLSREIATVGALSSLGGVNPMLRFHMGAALHVGLTENQAKALVALIGSEVGIKAGTMPAKCCSRFWTVERSSAACSGRLLYGVSSGLHEPLIQETTHGRAVRVLESQVPQSPWLNIATTEENRQWYCIKKTVLDKHRG